MQIKTLVVDNNPVLLKAISTILTQEGCQVLTATNGLQALEILKKYTPDIVFTDLVMPLVGGEQLCKIIRNTEELADVYLVVVSAIVLEDIDRILEEGNFDLCIAKGKLQDMRVHIQEALNQYRSRKSVTKDENDFPARIPDGLRPSRVTSELLSANRHLSRIVDNLHEGIVELSSQGVIVSLNTPASLILGRLAEEVIGKPFTELLTGLHLESVDKWVNEEVIGGGNSSLEITEDAPLYLGDQIVTASFLSIAEQDEPFGICILRDITRQYQAEAHEREMDNALKMVKKMEAMSCMAGGIAHDFNNLLTVICGNLDILTMEGKGEREVNKHQLIEHARNAAYIAVDLTRKISCFSPFGIIHRKNILLEDLVQEVAEEYFTEHPGAFDFHSNSHDIIVQIDPEQIAQALRNVLQNAQEAGPEQEIRIEIADVEFDTPTITAGQYVQMGRYAKVAITDAGCGIDSEDLFKVFDPYYSTKERGAMKGMGLGLTVVYATLRNHGGYVIVESERHKGTTVSFFIPAYSERVEEAVDILSGERTVRKEHILLVERDNQLQDVGRVMLKYLDYQVTVVKNLNEAIDFLVTQKQTDPPVTVVLYDYSQEERAQPQSISKALNDLNLDVQIIVTGRAAMDPVMQNFRTYGFANALPMPYTMDSLRHALMTLTDKSVTGKQ